MGRRTTVLMVIAAALLAVLVLLVRRAPVVPSPDRPSIAPAASTPIQPSYRLAARSPRRTTAYPSAQDANPLALLPGATVSTTDYRGGMAALQRLPAVLATNDIAPLRVFLTVPFDPAGGLTAREFNGLKNSAADLLLRQPDVPADLVVDFAAMYLDTAYDSVWRDYCLQFLSAGHEALSGRDGSDVSEARVAAVEVLRAATGDRTETYAGTALLGLNAISGRDTEAVKAAEVASLAADVAKDERASEACRITALRVAGASGAAAVVPIARELAQTGETETLRQAAVATIGDLGTADDQELLDALAHDSDKYVAATAKQAAERLRKRRAERTVEGEQP